MTEVLIPSGAQRHAAAHDNGVAPTPEKGGNMATAAIALNNWSVKYYETRAVAERARIDVTPVNDARRVTLFGQFRLVPLFGLLIYLSDKLLSRLATLETQPSSFLLEGEAAKIPQSLRQLFRITCDILQKAQEEGLHKSFLLGHHIARLQKFSQELIGFADRFEDAQQKLRSHLAPEEAEHYREALEAYKNCELKTEQATEEDVKTETLRF